MDYPMYKVYSSCGKLFIHNVVVHGLESLQCSCSWLAAVYGSYMSQLACLITFKFLVKCPTRKNFRNFIQFFFNQKKSVCNMLSRKKGKEIDSCLLGGTTDTHSSSW